MANNHQLYQKAFELVNKHSLTDATHQPDHIERVLDLVEYLAKKEGILNQIDLESLKLAAIFHDLGSIHRIKKLRKSGDKFKSEEHAKQGFRIAQKFLKEEGVSKPQIEKIQIIITSHGVNGSADDLEGNLLHDADLLDGIGLGGSLRIFTFGGQINRSVLGSLEYTKQKALTRKFKTKTGQKLGDKRIKKVLDWLKTVENELAGNDLI